MKFIKKAGAALGAAVFASALLVAAAPAPAQAASCYAGAQTFYKPGNKKIFLSQAFTTTTACRDINLKSQQNTFVRVCFRRIDIFTNCQANYTHVYPGQWAVIATNVLDGKDFLFEYYNDGPGSGQVAA